MVVRRLVKALEKNVLFLRTTTFHGLRMFFKALEKNVFLRTTTSKNGLRMVVRRFNSLGSGKRYFVFQPDKACEVVKPHFLLPNF